MQPHTEDVTVIAAGNRVHTGTAFGPEAAEHAPIANEDSLARDLSMISEEDFMYANVAEISDKSEIARLNARVAELEATLSKTKMDAENYV